MKLQKIGFILLSNSRRPIPSTRIAVLNMFPFLRAANFDPHIVFEPDEGTEMPDVSHLAPRLIADGFRIVYFQKVHGPTVEALARQLSLAGIKTVYGVCDLVSVPMAKATHATLAVTDYLKSLYPSSLQAKIHVVHDGIEHPEIQKTNWGKHKATRYRPLRAVLVTSAELSRLPVIESPPDWLHVTIVGRYPHAHRRLQRLRETYWTLSGKQGWSDKAKYLRFLTDRRIHRVAWDPVDVYRCMRESDIGIIPIDTWPKHWPDMPCPGWKVKSENRLTMKMSIGLPVVATPIPSYEPVVQHGENAYLPRTRQEWMDCLEQLRDPYQRRRVGEMACESVRVRYSMQAQADRMIAVLRGLVSQDRNETFASRSVAC